LSGQSYGDGQYGNNKVARKLNHEKSFVTRFRNSAKALIIEDNRLLAIQHAGVSGQYHALPGGGQRPFETLTDALKRECIEELGVHVDVGDLLFIREYIGKNHEFAEKDGDAHQIEFYF
jgi:ADP-ribose pyrophosphatase YjhB (NUDIX family)